MRNSIRSGKIKDILQLKEGFYEELKEGLEEEEEFEDEPSSPKEIILQLMSNRFESCSEESMTMFEILENVGFDSQFAEDYANHIEADPLDMSRWDWIHHFVVSSLDHLLMKCLNGKADGTKQTVAGNSSGDSLSQQNKDSTSRDIGKYLNDENFPKNLLDYIKREDYKPNSDIIEFWYHGTSTEYAREITTYGIELDKGKENANYSHKYGFYLTDNLNLAMRSAFQKYCLPNFNNKGKTVEEIAIIMFPFESRSTENFPRIDLRPTEAELANEKLESKNENRLRNIVHFFSEGAKMKKKLRMSETERNEWQREFKDFSGLEDDYKKKIHFIVGPYTSFEGMGHKREKENIQIPDLNLVQLCLRKTEIKEKFEEIMNPKWLLLKIPRGYSEVIKQNKDRTHERGNMNSRGNIAKPQESENVKKYNTKFFSQILVEYVRGKK